LWTERQAAHEVQLFVAFCAAKKAAFSRKKIAKSRLDQYFWYFWLTIQNTTSRQVRNLFYLVAVFISFPLARAAAAVAAADFGGCCCAPPPHPAPFLGGREVSKKKKIACSVGDGVWTCLCRRGRGRGRGAV
jgi:predicted nucleotidyltransferase